MSWLDRFRPGPSDDDARRRALVALVMERLTIGNRIRAEDAICAAATIVGERCVDAAGEFSLREHDYVPGTRVFSDRVNQILCGDSPEALEAVPAQSVYGILRAGVNSDYYAPKDFPSLVSVFSGFAAGIGDEKDWGKVPVTVLPRNYPTILPLQFGFESRDRVDAILRDIVADKLRCLTVATQALVALLNQMKGAIEPDVALRLAFEITNGMAKTAPMTAKALAAAQRKGKS